MNGTHKYPAEVNPSQMIIHVMDSLIIVSSPKLNKPKIKFTEQCSSKRRKTRQSMFLSFLEGAPKYLGNSETMSGQRLQKSPTRDFWVSISFTKS